MRRDIASAPELAHVWDMFSDPAYLLEGLGSARRI